jgi:RAB6A-GEF complex partner protein 1
VNVAQMMVATDKLSVLRINWEGMEERDYSLDLRRIPFSINQQVHYGKQSISVNRICTIELIDS